jgi:prepilin-type N-terminal cleavage/methylation domain-containing protein
MIPYTKYRSLERLNKRLEAFTLLEIIVTMVVSSIVIGGAFIIEQNLRESAFQWTEIQEKNLNLRTQLLYFEKDFRTANLIRVDDQNLYLTNSSDTVCYKLMGGTIRVKGDVSDTLDLNLENVKLTPDNPDSMVAQISMMIIYGDSKIDYTLNKLYSYSELYQWHQRNVSKGDSAYH